MTKSALVVVAEGFEDIEAVAPIDVMTRAGVEVTVAGVRPGPVKGANGTTVLPAVELEEVRAQMFDAVVFPGGELNVRLLAADHRVIELIRRHDAAGKLVAAICAAPSVVLAEAAGILRGRRATGDQGFDPRLAAAGAKTTGADVTVDGNIITGRGLVVVLAFSLAIVERLAGKETADTYRTRWSVPVISNASG